MLIDWLTLRIPLDDNLGVNLHQRLRDYMGVTVNIDSNGVEKWRKHSLDIDTLRSDCAGLFWSITGDGVQYYLNVGASPASIEFNGLNVFGSVDVEHCAKIMFLSALARFFRTGASGSAAVWTLRLTMTWAALHRSNKPFACCWRQMPRVGALTATARAAIPFIGIRRVV